jgi:hypothetical protein
MTDKEKYKILCTKELSIPLYSRDWWLDCVCGENKWDVLLYYKGEEIEAAMPFYSPGKSIITMPAFTQTLGIWFNPEMENPRYSKNLFRKQQICKYFIEHLPKHDYFLQNFHYTFTDWLPFYWAGYRQTTRYTYVLPDINNPDELWKNLSENIRRNIQKAKNKYALTIKKNVPVDLFMEINTQTFKRQGKKSYQPDILKKIIAISCSRNQGDIWGAFDEQGRLHAAVFIVWQNNCAYYLAAGGDTKLRQFGGQAVVLWEVICEVSKIAASFDFEGSMIQGVEHFFREFGAAQMPYYSISKGKLNLLDRLKLKLSI